MLKAEEVLHKLFLAFEAERSAEARATGPIASGKDDGKRNVSPASSDGTGTSAADAASAAIVQAVSRAENKGLPAHGTTAKTPEQMRRPLPSILYFTSQEQAALTDALKKLVEFRDSEIMGPRSIRNFVFRYQLARLLLKELGEPSTPAELADALVKAMTTPNAGPQENEGTLMKVARQIS